MAKQQPVACTKFGLGGHDEHTPSASTSSGRKSSTKRSRFDSQLDALSNEQSQLINLAKSSHDIKLASFEVKRLKIVQTRDSAWFAAEEQALVLKKEMHKKELALKERMLKYQLKIARLNAGQVSVPLGAHPVGLAQEGNSTTAYPSYIGMRDFSQDLFAFGTGTTTATTMTTTTPFPSTSATGHLPDMSSSSYQL